MLGDCLELPDPSDCEFTEPVSPLHTSEELGEGGVGTNVGGGTESWGDRVEKAIRDGEGAGVLSEVTPMVLPPGQAKMVFGTLESAPELPKKEGGGDAEGSG